MGERLKLLRAQMLNTCTTIYEEESMTGLELAAKTACKVNECVKMVNMLIDNLEKIIEDHIEELVNTDSFRIEDEGLVFDKGGEE